MQHTIRITIEAKDGEDLMLNPNDVDFIVDGTSGFLRSTEEPVLQERERVDLELDSSVEREYLLDTLDDWTIKLEEDPKDLPSDILKTVEPEKLKVEENEYERSDVVKLTKEVMLKIEKKFEKSRDIKERRFLKQVELMTRAFLQMEEGRKRLADLLGDVDVKVRVELLESYDPPGVVPLPSQPQAAVHEPPVIETKQPGPKGKRRKSS